MNEADIDVGTDLLGGYSDTLAAVQSSRLVCPSAECNGVHDDAVSQDMTFPDSGPRMIVVYTSDVTAAGRFFACGVFF